MGNKPSWWEDPQAHRRFAYNPWKSVPKGSIPVKLKSLMVGLAPPELEKAIKLQEAVQMQEMHQHDAAQPSKKPSYDPSVEVSRDYDPLLGETVITLRLHFTDVELESTLYPLDYILSRFRYVLRHDLASNGVLKPLKEPALKNPFLSVAQEPDGADDAV